MGAVSQFDTCTCINGDMCDCLSQVLPEQLGGSVLGLFNIGIGTGIFNRVLITDNIFS